MRLRLREKAIEVSVSAERDDLIPVAEMMNDIERVAADRSGRSENGNPFGQARQLYLQHSTRGQSGEACFQ